MVIDIDSNFHSALGQERDRLPGLSQRERDVLALMAEGRSNLGISQKLSLSPKTVEAHVGSILLKLGVRRAVPAP